MRTSALFWLLLALAACTGGGVSVTRQQVIVASLDSHIRMLNSIGEIETVIVANPFPQDSQGAAIRAAMASTPVFPRLRYLPNRPAGDAYGYRVVTAFGGWPVGGDDYCRNPALAPRPPSTDITEVTAVLCVGTSVLSESAARTARIDDPGDPRLTRLMNATVLALFSQSSRFGIGVPGIGIGINL
jgi:hypothetical protein